MPDKIILPPAEKKSNNSKAPWTTPRLHSAEFYNKTLETWNNDPSKNAS